MIWSRELGSSEAIAKALGTSGLHCRLVQMIRLITVLSIEMTISDGSVQIAVCLFCNIALFFRSAPRMAGLDAMLTEYRILTLTPTIPTGGATSNSGRAIDEVCYLCQCRFHAPRLHAGRTHAVDA